MSSDLVKQVPTAFISYSWDTAEHREWVTAFGARLRSDGIDLSLDQWHLQPGDQIPFYMERSIRESDFVIIVCTPRYKQKSDARTGGVGYEGNIIGGEVLNGANDRKFIPILREGTWREAAPSWLLGKVFIDFSGNPYSEESYEQLISAIYGILPNAPRAGTLSPASGQLSPESITRQGTYGDLVNAALRVLQAAQNIIIVRKEQDSSLRALLSGFEHELQVQGSRFDNLVREITLFSSESVKKSMGGIVTGVFAARIVALDTALEEKFDEARQRVLKAIPGFREEIRKEIGLR